MSLIPFALTMNEVYKTTNQVCYLPALFIQIYNAMTNLH